MVRVIIDATGRVDRVIDSPFDHSPAGPFHDEFRSAVDTALEGWVFEPAQRRLLEEGEDFDGDGAPDYRRVVSSEAIPVYLDLRFDFRIVDGEGVVASP